MASDIDIQDFVEEVNRHAVRDIRFALTQTAEHPLRGEDRSSSGSTGHGKVANGEPKSGVRVSALGGEVIFTLTEVSGEHFAWDKLSMSPKSFEGFKAALLDVLRKRSG